MQVEITVTLNITSNFITMVQGRVDILVAAGTQIGEPCGEGNYSSGRSGGSEDYEGGTNTEFLPMFHGLHCITWRGQEVAKQLWVIKITIFRKFLSQSCINME